MTAAGDSAIRYLLDQRPADTSASSISTLVQALQDRSLVADLVGKPENAALLKELLTRLVTVANDGSKATAVRVMCLESFYWLSSGAGDAVCQGTLFQFLQQLNESFEDMLEREAEVLTAQQEMLAVLLLRCSGYTKLKAGDVLQQLCHNDESLLVSLLISMLKNPSYEWPLVQAALRWLYELTTPATYFTAETATETTKVHAFQGKVSVLLEHCVSRHALAEVLTQLVSVWQRPSSQALLGGLSRVETVSSVTALTSSQQRELLQWAVMIRYLSVLAHNFSEFSNQPKLVRALQESVLTEGQEFLVCVLLPFITAVIHAWERDRVSSGGSGSTGDVAAAAGGREAAINPFLNAAIAALRLLRFVLYSAASSSASSSALGGGGGNTTTTNTAAANNNKSHNIVQTSSSSSSQRTLLKSPLLLSLQYLFQLCSRLEPSLKLEYPGMLVLLLTVQCGCNVNATRIRGAPVDLASTFEVLVSTIANDKHPIRADSPYVTSLAFLICFRREDSPFAVTQAHGNESVALVMAKLQAEEAELEGDERTLGAIVAMQEQLEYLQAVIMQAALGQLLAELGAISNRLEASSAAAKDGAAGQGSNPLLGRRPSTTTPADSPSTHAKKAKKAKHPSAFCCQLTGKLMREPVILKKTGHRFEYDALMNIVQQMGHVDPLTGEDVDEEFEVDEGLRQEIADYRVTHATKKL